MTYQRVNRTADTYLLDYSIRRTGGDLNDCRSKRELIAEQLVNVGVLVFEEEQPDGPHGVEGKAQISNGGSLVRLGDWRLSKL